MFLSRIFKKDYRHYMDKGDGFISNERFAEARSAFFEALARIDDEASSCVDRSIIEEKIQFAGNRLGEMNLQEAGYCLESGDLGKALDHLDLVIELAENSIIRQKADNLRTQIEEHNQFSDLSNNNNCSSCSNNSHEKDVNQPLLDHNLSNTDRFSLLINVLPDGLAERYAALGEEFAYGYLLIDEGKDADAFKVFSEMLAVSENDILLYEMALIKFRASDIPGAESLLRLAMKQNARNPLLHLALVQLLMGEGRFSEAISVLENMIGNDILRDQARLMLGEAYSQLGNEDSAMNNWTMALSSQITARSAAESIIPLLQKMGRNDEAVFLAKKYLKGCC